MEEALNWLTTTFQDISSNLDGNGGYVNYYFADVTFVEVIAQTVVRYGVFIPHHVKQHMI